MNKLHGVIMAFDFGLKNLGIAIGQEISMTANTFYSLNAKDGIAEKNAPIVQPIASPAP